MYVQLNLHVYAIEFTCTCNCTYMYMQSLSLGESCNTPCRAGQQTVGNGDRRHNKTRAHARGSVPRVQARVYIIMYMTPGECESRIRRGAVLYFFSSTVSSVASAS